MEFQENMWLVRYTGRHLWAILYTNPKESPGTCNLCYYFFREFQSPKDIVLNIWAILPQGDPRGFFLWFFLQLQRAWILGQGCIFWEVYLHAHDGEVILTTTQCNRCGKMQN